MFTAEAVKEEFFETVRAKEFPNVPPRNGAIFLFASHEDALWANATWWKGQRTILSASLIHAPRIGAFDAKWLDVSQDEWETAARAYWAGERTEHPRIEILVDGVVQLAGWEPFARLLGQSN